jgi:hypothetical protein
MKPLWISVAACATLWLAACGGDGADDTTVAFTTVEAATQSSITATRTAVVRDTSAWQALWDEHKRGVTPTPALPSVDFAQDMVIAAFLGQRPNLCYGVTIESIRARDGRLTVDYRESVPAPGAPCGAALSFPAHLVRVKRSDAPVDFVKRG